MRKVVVVVVTPAVGLQEDLRDATWTLLCLCGPRMHEVWAVVDSAVRVTEGMDFLGRTPAITDDRSAGFDPVTYDGLQCVCGSVWYGNKKQSPGLMFNTAKHPLTPNRVPPMVLPPTEFALVNLDGPIRTTNIFGAALQEHQHGFAAEHAPVCDGLATQGQFILDMEGRFAAHDAARDENFIESKITILEPRVVLNGRRPTTPGPTTPLPTSPPK
jgi:hypothetical protein